MVFKKVTYCIGQPIRMFSIIHKIFKTKCFCIFVVFCFVTKIQANHYFSSNFQLIEAQINSMISFKESISFGFTNLQATLESLLTRWDDIENDSRGDLIYKKILIDEFKEDFKSFVLQVVALVDRFSGYCIDFYTAVLVLEKIESDLIEAANLKRQNLNNSEITLEISRMAAYLNQEIRNTVFLNGKLNEFYSKNAVIEKNEKTVEKLSWTQKYLKLKAKKNPNSDFVKKANVDLANSIQRTELSTIGIKTGVLNELNTYGGGSVDAWQNMIEESKQRISEKMSQISNLQAQKNLEMQSIDVSVFSPFQSAALRRAEECVESTRAFYLDLCQFKDYCMVLRREILLN